MSMLQAVCDILSCVSSKSSIGLSWNKECHILCLSLSPKLILSAVKSLSRHSLQPTLSLAAVENVFHITAPLVAFIIS